MLISKTNTQCMRFTPFLKQCYITATLSINLSGAAFPAVLYDVIVYSFFPDSWFAIALGVAVLFGSFLTVPLIERVGWILADYIASTVAVIAWLISVPFVFIPWIAIPTRIISVVSFGLITPLRAIAIAEYTSPKNRGAFLTTIALIQGCSFFIIHITRTLYLRYGLFTIIIACIFFPILSLSLYLFMPESPSWLISKGRYEECRQVFHWLRGDGEASELDAMIQARMKFDEECKDNSKLDNIRLLSHIKKPELYKPIIVMLHLYAITYFSGAAIITAYDETVIKLVIEVESDLERWITVLYSERVIVNFIAIFLINIINRRTMVLASTGMCIATQITIAAYTLYRSSCSLTGDDLWIPGTLMVIHMFIISIGTVPLPIVIAGEVFSLQYKSIGLYISMISTIVNMFLSLKTFPVLVDNFGISGTYTIYASGLTYCLIVVWFLLPETNGKTLYDIEKEYKVKVTEANNEELQTLKGNPEEINYNTIGIKAAVEDIR